MVMKKFKKLLLPILLAGALLLLVVGILVYKGSHNYNGSSLSRNIYCGAFRFFDKSCDLNNNWVAKDSKTKEYVVVQGTDNTTLLDTVGARTVLEFTRDASGSTAIMCLAGADGVNGKNGTNGTNRTNGTCRRFGVPLVHSLVTRCLSNFTSRKTFPKSVEKFIILLPGGSPTRYGAKITSK